MSTNLETRFDGLETRIGGDEYIGRCKGGAINLHIYSIGNYSGCTNCEYQNECLSSAFIAGEQTEF